MTQSWSGPSRVPAAQAAVEAAVQARTLGKSRAGTRAAGRARAWIRRIADFMVVEHGRWGLWSPIALGAGLVLYFALPREPEPWVMASIAALSLATIAWCLAREALRGSPALPVLILGAAIGLGACLGAARTMIVEAPVVERRERVTLDATVVDVDRRRSRPRVLLEDIVVDDHRDDRRARRGRIVDATPERLRLSLATESWVPVLGARVRIEAVVNPPPEPIAPGAYDFQRRAFFERLGGVGFAVAPPVVLATPPPSLTVAVRSFRDAVSDRIRAAVPPTAGEGQAAEVAVALITGDRDGLGSETLRRMRDAGLAHLLAISGLHMGLVAGFVFALFRLGLAFCERLSLRSPVKKVAAVAALIAAVAYLAVSGASVPTQRAFLMTGVVLMAVLVDRRAISMRLVAIAAALILLIAPESVLSPSFQLSFAAVAALVALYEVPGISRRLSSRSKDMGPPLRLVVFLVALVLTSVVANLATAPFAAFHFGRIATWGPIANLLAVPLTAFWIMPAGVLGLVLMPFGAEAIGLVPMGWGIAVLLDWAVLFADAPGAVWTVARVGDGAMSMFVVGFLLLCVMASPLRLVGLACAGVTLPLLVTTPPPDLFVSRDASVVAVRLGDDEIVSLGPRDPSFTLEGWASLAGVERVSSKEEAGAGVPCDPLGCVVRVHGTGEGDRSDRVGVSYDPAGVAADCAAVDVLVVTHGGEAECQDDVLVLSPRFLRDTGPVLLRLRQGNWEVVSMVEARGDRPWVLR